MLLPNNVTYIPFLYIKTSKQDYLIYFNSSLFHSFSLNSLHSIPLNTYFHYLNLFHSIIFLYDLLIPLLYELPTKMYIAQSNSALTHDCFGAPPQICLEKTKQERTFFVYFNLELWFQIQSTLEYGSRI